MPAKQTDQPLAAPFWPRFLVGSTNCQNHRTAGIPPLDAHNEWSPALFTLIAKTPSDRRPAIPLGNHRRWATLASEHDQEISFQAPATPGLVRLRATVRQRDVTCSAEALITVTDSLVPSTDSGVIDARGLPGYTFECASGELWRCRFDATRNVIVVNNGHRDFVFASRTQALKLRYLLRLYVKELVLRNFSGVPGDELLERMIELSLYTEDKL
jgi:hypothetical protein